MQGEREAKGVINWKSISSKLALTPSIESTLVRDCREDATIVEANRTLFDVIPLIAEAGYVLVRHNDRKIKGPVTTSDLSLHLQALTEPFLCLREKWKDYRLDGAERYNRVMTLDTSEFIRRFL
jgi:hypothetical protein